MDVIAQKANQARSKRGADFETKLGEIFYAMKKRKKIKDFRRVRKEIYGGEFNPDFIVTKNSGKIVSIDATTTARTDRLRGKQWDAYGTKMFYRKKKKIEIKAYVVVQDAEKSKREAENLKNCKRRCKLPHSALNGTLSINELIKILKK